jgi:dTDP-glucose 4,6-dehydratase/UDP-glucose 4-epimerase
MTPRRILVTGGTGFIGSAVVRALVAQGHGVRSLDNDSRGSARRLADVAADIELVTGDIRDPAAVAAATRGIDAVCHLAAVNGTRHFYERPELVLEVAIRGMLNVLDACREHGVGDLVVFSSSEAYQTPPVVPTPEDVPLVVPDVLEPRYSYGGGKLASELLAINFGRTGFSRVAIVRPHNVFGPDMGREHVIPELSLKVAELRRETSGAMRLPIQGSGQETRAFLFIDDFVEGFLRVFERGEHLGIYHIGSDQETTIGDVARDIGAVFGRPLEVVPGQLAAGGTLRRCPDISRLRALGFSPRMPWAEALATTVHWYDQDYKRRHAALQENRHGHQAA